MSRSEFYEFRFSRIESDLEKIESSLNDIKGTVHAVDVRLAKVEGQMEIMIEMLKGKKSI